MGLNWSRLPMTHFEDWARVIKFVTPKFFEKDDFDPAEEAKNFEIEDGSRIYELTKDVSGMSRERKEDALHALKMNVNMLDGSIKRLETSVEVLQDGKNHLDELWEKMKPHEEAAGTLGVADAISFDAAKNVVVYDKAHKKAKKDSAYLTNDGVGGSDAVFASKSVAMEEQLIFLRDFNDAGRKVFRIEEQITHELTLTHIEGVLAQFFKLPYQTICVHIPYNEVIRMHGLPVQWCYLSEYEEQDGRHIHTMYVTSDGFPSFFEFILDDNNKLGEQVRGQVDEKYGKAAAKEHMGVFSMIASMVLYMNSEGRDVREVKPRVMDARKDSRLPACSIGGTIRVDKTLYMGSNEDGSASDRTIHILKWTVRGHFRNQAHGAGRKERRIQWIRPYLKGRERGNEKMSAKNTEYVIHQPMRDIIEVN